MHLTSPKCDGIFGDLGEDQSDIKVCNAVGKSGSGREVRQRTDAAAGGGGRARRQIGGRGVEARAGSAAAAATGQAE